MMTMAHAPFGSESTNSSIPRENWRTANLYRFTVAIVEEEDNDGYSIVALNLPGTVSEGDSEEEAIENFKEAAAGVIESYKACGEKIPWVKVLDDAIPKNAKMKVVLVDA